MNKFKIGDTVRIVQICDGNGFKIEHDVNDSIGSMVGKIHTITCILTPDKNEYGYYALSYILNGLSCGFRALELELITDYYDEVDYE